MFLHPYSLQNASCLSYFTEVSSVNSVVRNYFIWKIISFEFQNSSSFIFRRANSPNLGHYIMESLVKKAISSLMSNVTFTPYQRIWMDCSVIHPSQYCPGINSFLPEFFRCIKCSFKKEFCCTEYVSVEHFCWGWQHFTNHRKKNAVALHAYFRVEYKFCFEIWFKEIVIT